MKILILGGTHFLGRHLTAAALARGHTLTLFNRGRTNPGLFPEVERLQGDRDGDLQSLAGRSWDAVIDTSGYLPRVVRQSAERLRGRVGRYLFISSISVYRDTEGTRLDEDSPLEVLEDASFEDVKLAYGALKAACERVVEETHPDGALIVRPGLIVGPHDPTGRFTWWVRRVPEGGKILAPGDPSRPVQFIDARDLAAWLLVLIERGETGTLNATGPRETLTLGKLLDTIGLATESDARFTWVSEEFLLSAGIQPWTGIPLWLPERLSGMLRADITRAVRAGLAFRPLAGTITDTLAWDRGVGAEPPDHAEPPPGVGLDRDRERELLDAWRTRGH